MSRCNQLRNIVESLGYDEALARVLNRGCSKLSEGKASELLEKIEEIQRSIPSIIATADLLIADARKSVGRGAANCHLVQTHDVSDVAECDETEQGVQSSTSGSGKEGTEALCANSKQPLLLLSGSQAQEVNAFSGVLTPIAEAMRLASEVYWGAFQGMLNIAIYPLEYFGKSTPERTEDSRNDSAVEAVKRAIAAANLAYDSISSAAAHIAELQNASGVERWRVASPGLISDMEIYGGRSDENYVALRNGGPRVYSRRK